MEHVTSKAKEFLHSIDGSRLDHMSIDNSGVITFDDDSNYLSFDPVNGVIYTERGRLYPLDFDFEGDIDVRTIVDKTGRDLFEKAKHEHYAMWVENFTF